MRWLLAHVPRVYRFAWDVISTLPQCQENISKKFDRKMFFSTNFTLYFSSCPDCGWIMCHKNCVGFHKPEGHSVWECQSFKKHNLASFLTNCDEKDIRFIFESILSVRCLLLKQINPEKWRQLSEMESHNKIRRNIPTLWNRNQELIVNRLRNQWGYKEFSEDEIHTVCGILEVNSFEVGSSGRRARALFPEAYLICHDCQPNTTHTVVH